MRRAGLVIAVAFGCLWGPVTASASTPIVKVLTDSGNGTASGWINTPKFVIPKANVWTISWSYDCRGTDYATTGAGSFDVEVKTPGATGSFLTTSSKSHASGAASVRGEAGAHLLSVLSLCPWSVAVTRSAAPASPVPTTTVAPKPVAVPTTTTSAPVQCSPISDEGTCYEPGEYCRDDDHGSSGVAGDGKQIVCEDNDGWRWEPV